jgi:hypothetical protein
MLAGTRQALAALCVREPPVLQAPSAPLLASPIRRVEVVFTELAGNALRHAGQPVRIHLSSTAEAWLIGVDDNSPELEPQVGSLDTDQVGGRGLAITLTMASRVGWFVEGGTKTVWAEVPDAPPESLLQRLRQPRSGLSRTGDHADLS